MYHRVSSGCNWKSTDKSSHFITGFLRNLVMRNILGPNKMMVFLGLPHEITQVFYSCCKLWSRFWSCCYYHLGVDFAFLANYCPLQLRNRPPASRRQSREPNGRKRPHVRCQMSAAICFSLWIFRFSIVAKMLSRGPQHWVILLLWYLYM